MENKDTEEIRKKVSEDYARAVSSGTGCCQPKTSCCGPTDLVVPKGNAAKLAGYQKADVDGIPQDAVENSFGCGNPLAFSDVKEGQTVLDLGSGAGIDLLIAAKKVGSEGKVIGVDMTDEMIERARANIKTAGLDNVEVRKGIIEELPVDADSVDWVISNCVINLSPEKPRVFSEIARVLRSGGTMQVSDIVVEDLPDWVKKSAEVYSACIGGAISEADYLQGVRDAGLVDVEVKERLVYEPMQVLSLVENDVELDALLDKLGVTREQAGEALRGNVSSIKVAARKP